MERKHLTASRYFQKYILNDPSTWSLILCNLLIIFLAVIENWDLLTLMWIYWFQSVIIGFFNFIRILTLKKFSTKGFTIIDKPVRPTKSTKIFTAFFFAFHYGVFHFVYAVFLSFSTISAIFFPLFVDSGPLSKLSSDILSDRISTWISNWIYIILTAAIFFINHLFSFLYNKKRDEKKKSNIRRVMLFPYARIIPMHFTILFGWGLMFGVGTQSALILFLVLKTIADVIMHTIEHAE